MKALSFEWDEQKNRLNYLKHGIEFNEAATVFFDNNAVIFDDPDHSDYEERFLIIGMSDALKILIISHCIRNESVVRIISARKATKREARYYIDTL